MKHICAWCDVETEPPDGKNDHLTTHGICRDCQKSLLADFEKYRQATKDTSRGVYEQ